MGQLFKYLPNNQRLFDVHLTIEIKIKDKDKEALFNIAF